MLCSVLFRLCLNRIRFPVTYFSQLDIKPPSALAVLKLIGQKRKAPQLSNKYTEIISIFKRETCGKSLNFISPLSPLMSHVTIKWTTEFNSLFSNRQNGLCPQNQHVDFICTLLSFFSTYECARNLTSTLAHFPLFSYPLSYSLSQKRLGATLSSPKARHQHDINPKYILRKLSFRSR